MRPKNKRDAFDIDLGKVQCLGGQFQPQCGGKDEAYPPLHRSCGDRVQCGVRLGSKNYPTVIVRLGNELLLA
jgi:hypothetical protein